MYCVLQSVWLFRHCPMKGALGVSSTMAAGCLAMVVGGCICMTVSVVREHGFRSVNALTLGILNLIAYRTHIRRWMRILQEKRGRRQQCEHADSQCFQQNTASDEFQIY